MEYSKNKVPIQRGKKEFRTRTKKYDFWILPATRQIYPNFMYYIISGYKSVLAYNDRVMSVILRVAFVEP